MQNTYKDGNYNLLFNQLRTLIKTKIQNTTIYHRNNHVYTITCSKFDHPYSQCTVSIIFFLLCILIMTFHALYRNTVKQFSPDNLFLSLKLALIIIITLCCFLYLQHKFWLKMALLKMGSFTYSSQNFNYPGVSVFSIYFMA